MKTLIDTCVLSEVQKPGPDPTVVDAIAAIAAPDFFLSVITISEIVFGIERLDPGTRKQTLDNWVREIQEQHADRLLPVDLKVASICGQITAKAQKQGRTLSTADGLIAATALRHDLLLMTRNTKDFDAIGARIHNPWTD